MTETEADVQKLPLWAGKPFSDFLDYLENLNSVAEVAAIGIAIGQQIPKWYEVEGRESRPNYDADLERASRLATTAKMEVECDFPLLHSHLVVALWSGLENLATNLLVAWLRTDRARVLNDPKLAKLEVPIAQYERLPHDEQAELLAEHIERSLKAPLKLGTARFDEILELLGIQGAVDEGTKRTLFEMSQVRNVIVHCGSIVDRRLVTSCPWLEYSIGARLKIPKHAVQRYFRSALHYTLVKLNGAKSLFGMPKANIEPKPVPSVS